MVEELWVINLSGICLFHRSIHSDNPDSSDLNIGENQLFSGLLTGILTATSEFSSTDIRKMETLEGKFMFFKKKNLVFVVWAKVKSSDKKIQKKIRILQNLFIEKFKEELENFDGEVTTFHLFEDELDKVFKIITKSEKWGKGLLNL